MRRTRLETTKFGPDDAPNQGSANTRSRREQANSIPMKTAGYLFIAQTISMANRSSRLLSLHRSFQRWKDNHKDLLLNDELNRHEEIIESLNCRLVALSSSERLCSEKITLNESICSDQNELEKDEVDMGSEGIDLSAAEFPNDHKQLQVATFESNTIDNLENCNASDNSSDDDDDEALSHKSNPNSNAQSFAFSSENTCQPNMLLHLQRSSTRSIASSGRAPQYHSTAPSAHRTMLEVSFYRAADGRTHILDQPGWSKIAGEHAWDLRMATRAFRHYARIYGGHLGLNLDNFSQAIALLATESQLSLRDFLLETKIDRSAGIFSSVCSPTHHRQNQTQEMVNRVLTQRDQENAFRSLFETYAVQRGSLMCLTNARFAKMCRDCGVGELVRSGRLRYADIDLAYAKAIKDAHTKQGADIMATCDALGMLGHRAFISAESETLHFSQEGFNCIRAHILATSVDGI